MASRETLSLKNLDGCEMATLIIPDWNTQAPLIERMMQANGYSIRVGFRSDSPRAITNVIRETDMVYPASSFIDPEDMQGLQAFGVKLNNKYLNHSINAYYHQKNRRNPLTLWLASLIGDLLSE